MKIIVPAVIELPSTMANRQYTMWMCDALTKYSDVILCVDKLTRPAAEIYRFYNIPPSFQIREIGPVPRPRSLWFAWCVARSIANDAADLIYLSDVQLLWYLRRFARRKNYLYDAENLPAELKSYLACIRSTRAVVCYNQFFRNALVDLGVDQGKIMIAPSGVKLDDYRSGNDVKELRRELNLPVDKKIVMYTGHFYEWKGVDILLRSAALLEADTEVFLIGGKPADVERMTAMAAQSGSSNVRFISFQSPGLIPKYQQAADVLILPNVSASEHSSYFTSPLKLFQYMASRRPIVASDLPSLRTVLNGENSYLVPPDDAHALAQGIRDALSNHQESARRTERAREEVEKYTWEKRAAGILKFVCEMDLYSENGVRPDFDRGKLGESYIGG